MAQKKNATDRLQWFAGLMQLLQARHMLPNTGPIYLYTFAQLKLDGLPQTFPCSIPFNTDR